jgi:hypothetical protein
MGKMKFVYELMESQDYLEFEIAAFKAAEKGEDQFLFQDGVYDVKFAASVLAYIYNKKAEESEREQRHLFGVPDTWPTNDL